MLQPTPTEWIIPRNHGEEHTLSMNANTLHHISYLKTMWLFSFLSLADFMIETHCREHSNSSQFICLFCYRYLFNQQVFLGQSWVAVSPYTYLMLAHYLWMTPLGYRGWLHWKEAVLEDSIWIWGEDSPEGGAGWVLSSAVGPLLQQLKQVQASTPMEYVVKGCRLWRVCCVAVPSDSCRKTEDTRWGSVTNHRQQINVYHVSHLLWRECHAGSPGRCTVAFHSIYPGGIANPVWEAYLKHVKNVMA